MKKRGQLFEDNDPSPRPRGNRREINPHGCMYGEAGCPICHPDRYEYIDGKRRAKPGMAHGIWS